MKKIEKIILEEFFLLNSSKERIQKTLSERDSVFYDGSTCYQLHNTVVASRQGTFLHLNDGGWTTTTTANRLNAFLQAFNVRNNTKQVLYSTSIGFYTLERTCKTLKNGHIREHFVRLPLSNKNNGMLLVDLKHNSTVITR